MLYTLRESINPKVKSEDTEIIDSRNHRHVKTSLVLRAGSSCHRGGGLNFVPRFNLCTWTEAAVEAMSVQGNQGEVDPLVGVGHEISGADDGAQVVQLMQVQIAQIVSNEVCQEALTHQIQQLGKCPPSATAANHVT